MSQDGKQLHIRIDGDGSLLLDRIRERLRADLGCECSLPQVIAMALQALAEKHGVALEVYGSGK